MINVNEPEGIKKTLMKTAFSSTVKAGMILRIRDKIFFIFFVRPDS